MLLCRTEQRAVGEVLDPERVVGTWRLLSWVAHAQDGSRGEPFGPTPEGILVYTREGTMITTIGMPGREAIAANDLLAGDHDEILAMARSFIAYAGAYSVDGAAIVHRVELSLFPNWVGTVQRRSAELSPDGMTLALRTDPMAIRGVVAAHVLEWRRASE